jgi:hypothetical protein
METVREQILKKGKVYPSAVSHFSAAKWDYCPCVIEKKCKRSNIISCTVQIGIFFNTPHISASVIEIMYVGQTHRGFIRANNMQLNRLIEKGIIDRASLEKVTF